MKPFDNFNIIIDLNYPIEIPFIYITKSYDFCFLLFKHKYRFVKQKPVGIIL